jgi:hypothetical protein
MFECEHQVSVLHIPILFCVFCVSFSALMRLGIRNWLLVTEVVDLEQKRRVIHDEPSAYRLCIISDLTWWKGCEISPPPVLLSSVRLRSLLCDRRFLHWSLINHVLGLAMVPRGRTLATTGVADRTIFPKHSRTMPLRVKAWPFVATTGGTFTLSLVRGVSNVSDDPDQCTYYTNLGDTGRMPDEHDSCRATDTEAGPHPPSCSPCD